MRHIRSALPDVPCDIDDAAPVVSHPLAVALSRHEKSAMEVGAHHRIPTLEGDRSNWSGELSAGIVDKAVYAAMGIQNSGNGCLHLVLVANVTGVCRCDPSVIGYFDCDRVEFFRRAADQSDDGAKGCELMGSAPADTAAAPGNDDNLAGKEVLAKY